MRFIDDSILTAVTGGASPVIDALEVAIKFGWRSGAGLFQNPGTKWRYGFAQSKPGIWEKVVQVRDHHGNEQPWFWARESPVPW
jgi:hypothetical protein